MFELVCGVCWDTDGVGEDVGIVICVDVVSVFVALSI